MTSPFRAAVLCGVLLFTPVANATETDDSFIRVLQGLKMHWLLGIIGTSGTQGIIGTSGVEYSPAPNRGEGIIGTSGIQGSGDTSN